MSIELMPVTSFNDDDIYFWEPETKIIRRTIGCSDLHARRWQGAGETDNGLRWGSGLYAKKLGLFRVTDR